MGFFDKLLGKKKGVDNIIVGFLRTETSKLLGVEPNSKEYESAMVSAAKPIEETFLPCVNQGILQDVANTFNSISPNRVNEMFGEYIFLLFVRFGVITKLVASGEVQAEEATPDILANVIHNQIKSLIK